MLYGYHLLPPKQWTASALSDVLVNVLPRKIAAPEPFFKAVEPALSFYIAFLRDGKILTEKKAQALLNALKQAAPQMRARAGDTAAHSPAKKFLMDAIENGLD